MHFKNSIENKTLIIYIRFFRLLVLNSKENFLYYRLKIYYVIRKRPFLLKTAINILYFTKSTNYKRLIFAYRLGRWEDVRRLLASVPEKEKNLNYLKAKRIIQKEDLNYEGFIDTSKKMLSLFDLKTNLYDELDSILQKKLNHKIILVDSGGSHFGMITHSDKGVLIYHTKIKKLTNKKVINSIEYRFYTEIRTNNQQLKDYTASYVQKSAVGRYMMLTTEFIHGRKPQLDDLIIIEKAYSAIHKIKYQELYSSLEFKPLLYVLSQEEIFNVFSKKYIHAILIDIGERSRITIDKYELENDLLYLYSLFYKNKLYTRINFKEDLVLQHRDFGPHNCKIGNDENIKIYDWETYSLDLPGSDLLKFILFFTFNFDFIERKLFGFLEESSISNYQNITNFLTLRYLHRLVHQPEGVRIQENWDHAIDYLKRSPLNN